MWGVVMYGVWSLREGELSPNSHDGDSYLNYLE